MIRNKRRTFVGVLVLGALLGAMNGYGVKSPGFRSAGEILENLSSKGDLVEARFAQEDIPLDPRAEIWTSCPEHTLELVSQQTVPPKSERPRRLSLRVRAMYNSKDVGLWLSWDDASKNDLVASSESFQDAVAVEFPTRFDGSSALPYIGMGNKGRPVNVWQWKATWQLDVDKGYQGVEKVFPGMVPGAIKFNFRAGEDAGSSLSQQKKRSPVENLLAEGFGTITTIDSKGLSGKGVWDGKRWFVVLKRGLKGTKQGEPSFDGFTPIAFAVWDGGAAERNGSKVITRWRFLRLKKQVAFSSLASLETRPIGGADLKKGKDLIGTLRCFQCHVIAGFSDAQTMAGPDLSHAGIIHRPEYLIESIKSPSAVIVPYPGYSGEQDDSTMPVYDAQTLPEQDYKHIAAYLGSLE